MYNLNEVVRIIDSCNSYDELSKTARIFQTYKKTFAIVDLLAMQTLFHKEFENLKQ